MKNIIKAFGALTLGSVATSAVGIALGVGVIIVVGTLCAAALSDSAGDIAINAMKETKKGGAS